MKSKKTRADLVKDSFAGRLGEKNRDLDLIQVINMRTDFLCSSAVDGILLNEGRLHVEWTKLRDVWNRICIDDQVASLSKPNQVAYSAKLEAERLATRLMQEIRALRQGEDDLEAYQISVKHIWEELEGLGYI